MECDAAHAGNIRRDTHSVAVWVVTIHTSLLHGVRLLFLGRLACFTVPQWSRKEPPSLLQHWEVFCDSFSKAKNVS